MWKLLKTSSFYAQRRNSGSVYTDQRIQHRKYSILLFLKGMNGTKNIDIDLATEIDASYGSSNFHHVWLHPSKGQMNEILTPDI